MTETANEIKKPGLGEMDARITFHDDIEVMEADFADFDFSDSATVNAFYDRLEARIAETGENLWFFLVNYSRCRIDSDAWFAFSRRGKALNLAHSMGSVRFDASDETRRQIERSAGTEAFDANLFADRAGALARIAELPSKRVRKIHHDPNYTVEDFRRRVIFHFEDNIMEVDFSDFAFYHSLDVDMFYDHIEDRIESTGQKWFFLINYNSCQIMPEAWVEYARRGKALNIAASLGSVRFAAGSETEQEIRLRAESQDFRPNIRNTRDEALERIGELKALAG